ncbi:hypothetical protein DVH26_10885 [Paenibacillus sp. H1-7]|nr:hypothetical protein DVH26_09930 [Paenibacillus sp. H1-7]ULL14901.1 hypothetical protein DVH26_10885 [Paenibacillus sp. H1-7]
MIIFVVIIATNISLHQIKYFNQYKNLINRLTAFAFVTWFVVLIVYGIITGKAKTSFIDLKEDCPIYLIVFIGAITIQLLFARKSKDNKDTR